MTTNSGFDAIADVTPDENVTVESTVQVKGTAVTPSGTPTPNSNPDPGTLAFTGSRTLIMAMIAAGLILAGAMTLATGAAMKRRRAAGHG